MHTSSGMKAEGVGQRTVTRVTLTCHWPRLDRD